MFKYSKKSYLYLPATIFLLCFIYIVSHKFSYDTIIHLARNDYGTLTVLDIKRENRKVRLLYHGIVEHGMQFQEKSREFIPTTYYHFKSGVGQAIQFQHQFKSKLNIGVIGLGIGTVAALTHVKDKLTFYEIDPNVVQIAQNHFSFLNMPGNQKITIKIGDGRRLLAKDIGANIFERYDVLIIDAFSGDSIPHHLLTEQAFDLYKSAITSDGIIALHITNHYFNFKPIIKGLARHHELPFSFYFNLDDNSKGIYSSEWALVSPQYGFHQWLTKKNPNMLDKQKNLKAVTWTDEKNAIVPLFKLTY